MYDNLWRELREYLKNTNRPIRFPPATESDVHEAEVALGFQIPAILKEMYLEVGNGGFGPGSYGIIGLKGGHLSARGTLVDTYQEVKGAAEENDLPWPREYLPFCEWGCTIYSCVDCANPNGHMYRCEACELTPVNYTLEGFMKMWVGGLEILDHDDGPRETKEITNYEPFYGEEIYCKRWTEKEIGSINCTFHEW